MQNLRDRKIILILTIAVTTLLMAGCEKYDFAGFFGFACKEHVNKRFDQSMAYNEMHQNDTLITTESSSYRFFVSGDFHVKKEAINLGKFMTEADADNKSIFSAILGDITDQQNGLLVAKDTIDKRAHKAPIKYISGNHDLFFDQWKEFYELYGSSTYYFIVKSDEASDLYIMLESGSGTLGKKQTKWLKKVLEEKRELYRHCIVMTHVNFFDTNMDQFPSGNYSTEETAMLTHLFAKNKVDLVITGHDHHYDLSEYNGVKYLTLDAAKDDIDYASYFTIDVTENEIKMTEHQLSNIR